MRVLRLAVCLAFVTLAACGHANAVPPFVGVPLVPLDLSPAPVELTSDNASQTFVVQNDVPGTAYAATASPACQNPDGSGTFVAGDGQPMTAVAGIPTMFLAYAVGNAPATCSIAISSSTGDAGSVDVTYETIVLQSHRRRALTASPGAVPTTVTFTKANQVAQVALNNFNGVTTVSAGSCATGSSGISVNPKSLTNGGGTIVIAPFGIGAVSKGCTVTISDTASHHLTIPVSIATTAIGKFSVSPATVHFACAGTVPPLHCRTIQTVTIAEPGAVKFTVGARAFSRTNCDPAFQGPIKMVGAGGVPSSAVNGPSATVAFDGILNATSLSCSTIAIADGGDPEQIVGIRVLPQLGAAPPPAITAAPPPPCKGNDPYVAVPNGPHGMYVWIPTTFVPKGLIDSVIGQDPALCGASMVVYWADVEPRKGVFVWDSVLKTAAPFTNPGSGKPSLTVNLLFADATEGAANVTPGWVTAPTSQGGDGVPSIACTDTNTHVTSNTPVYFDPTYEKDWKALIKEAEQAFSFNGSPLDPSAAGLAPSVGYMRFATAGGAEALVPPLYNDNGPCQAQWDAAASAAKFASFYDVWNAHEATLISYMGSLPTDKQIMVSLPSLSGQQNVYTVPNLAANVAVAHHVGLSFESLGQSNVAAFNTTPHACDPAQQIGYLHWCQAYTRHAGEVPFAMQPITATTSTGVATMDIGVLLPYALDNNIQIFELYPDEWLEADQPGFTPAPMPNFTPNPAHYKAALQAASLVLGATNGH